MNELVNLIEGNYGVKINNIEKIKNAYKINTNYGDKCFKASKYDIRQFEFIINAITHLMNNGFEHIVKLDKTKNGKQYVNTGIGFGFLCDWIDSREVTYDNPIELRMSIDTLSKLHLASRNFKQIKIPSVRNQYGKWILRFKKRCDELLYFKAIISEKSFLNEFDRMYLKFFDNHYRQGLKTIKNLENSKYYDIMDKHIKMSGFCHHDTANHNFLITTEMKIYLIDFDYCIYDTHLHDLASIIIRNLKYGNWNLYKLEYILNEYSENLPISRDELYVLFCLMEFPQDFWQIGLQYYVEKQIWSEEYFVKKLTRTINDAKERNEFLVDLEGRV